MGAKALTGWALYGGMGWVPLLGVGRALGQALEALGGVEER